MCDLYDNNIPQEIKEKLPKPSGADEIIVQDCMSWLEELEERSLSEDLNDYFHNLKVIGMNGCVTMDMLGYAASIIIAYCKDKNKPLPGQSELKQTKKESNYIGSVGVRQGFVMRLVSMREVGDNFFPSTLVTFKDNDGNVAKWFASNAPDIEIDNWYAFTGSIKEHTEYNGKKETRVNRCNKFTKVDDMVFQEKPSFDNNEEEKRMENLKSKFSFLYKKEDNIVAGEKQ